MIRATSVQTSGSWDATTAADRIVLSHLERRRRRLVMRTAGGGDFLLDLPAAPVLRHGDALVLDDGRMVAVEAAPEPVADIRAGDPHLLLRLAWHLGNRHVAVEIEVDRIRIARDHVLEAMAMRLGAGVTHVEAPFDPEPGAYASGHDHEHGPGHAAHGHGRGG